MRKIRVLVLYGGQSAEHEVSVQSARTVVDNLDPKRYEARIVYIDRDGRWVPQSGRLPGPESRPALEDGRSSAPAVTAARGLTHGGRADVVFPVLHGPRGEDGSVQGLLELAGLPYVGAGILGSALGMDKEVSKRLVQGAGLRCPPHVLARQGERLDLSAVRKLGFPVFVKPARLGSSVGVRKVEDARGVEPAVRHALEFDTKVLVEKGVEGTEVAVAVLGDDRRAEAAVPGAILPRSRHAFFSYDAKYVDPDGFEFAIPAPLPKAVLSELRAQAVRAFLALDGYGMARVDFLVDRRGRIFFGEVNTIPGFTSHSLYPKLWEAAGVKLPLLLDKLIDLALRRSKRSAGLKTSYSAR